MKYYKEMNKWFTDKAVTLAILVTNHEALIAEEQEVDLDLKYSGNKHPDNQYAIQLFMKMKQHGQVQSSANLVADFNLETNSAIVVKPRYYTRPDLRNIWWNTASLSQRRLTRNYEIISKARQLMEHFATNSQPIEIIII